MKHEFRVGERVAFAREFLKNTGQHTGWAPFARGHITALSRLGERGLITVKWDGERRLQRVLDCNLWPVSKLHLEPV